MDSCARIYRPRRPQQTPLYRLLESLFEPVELCWEERFEARYGFWQGVLGPGGRALSRPRRLGLWLRTRALGECRYEVLVAFSCKQRELCPSCAAKRGAELAAFLVDHVLEDVGHAQWVFTIPKMLRPLFFRRRALRGTLARLAWQTVQKLMAAAACEPELRPGMVSVIQTFGDRINPHPHVHALVSRGSWTRDERFVPLPYVDPTAAERLFRHEVFAFLLREELISLERVEMLSSWRHSGE